MFIFILSISMISMAFFWAGLSFLDPNRSKSNMFRETPGPRAPRCQDDASGAQGPDEVFDGAGNKIEVKKSVTMTEKAHCGGVIFLGPGPEGTCFFFLRLGMWVNHNMNWPMFFWGTKSWCEFGQSPTWSPVPSPGHQWFCESWGIWSELGDPLKLWWFMAPQLNMAVNLWHHELPEDALLHWTYWRWVRFGSTSQTSAVAVGMWWFLLDDWLTATVAYEVPTGMGQIAGVPHCLTGQEEGHQGHWEEDQGRSADLWVLHGGLGGPLASFRVHPRSLWGCPKMGGWTPKPWHVVLEQPLEQGWQEEADPDRRRGLGFLADGKMWDGLEWGAGPCRAHNPQGPTDIIYCDTSKGTRQQWTMPQVLAQWLWEGHPFLEFKTKSPRNWMM